MLLLLLLVPSSTAQHTTAYPRYHVALRGGYVMEDYAYGNVYAVNSQGDLGPVCDDLWGEEEARVVCNQLGYNYGFPECRSHWGEVPSTFSMDNVQCHGQESHIQDCQYNRSDDCGSWEGAGVYCSQYAQTTTSNPRPSCDNFGTTTTTPYPRTTTTYPRTTTPYPRTTTPYPRTTTTYPRTTTTYPRTTTTEAISCPDGWVDFGASGCFLLSTEMSGVTWWEAAQFCEEQDGFLAEPRTREQLQFLTSLAFVEEALTGIQELMLARSGKSHTQQLIVLTFNYFH